MYPSLLTFPMVIGFLIAYVITRNLFISLVITAAVGVYLWQKEQQKAKKNDK